MPLRKVIGIHSCKEALKQRDSKDIHCLYLKENWIKNPSLKDLVQLAKRKNLKIETVSLKKINRMLDRKDLSHQGVLLELVPFFPKLSFAKIAKEDSATVLILDRIQDPKNLGAILRTCWLMSVNSVFLSSQKTVGLTPSVIKSASGAVEHLPIFIEDNLHYVIKELKKHSFWIYALSPFAKKTLWDENLQRRKAFVFGGEHSGLRNSLIKDCDEVLFLPQKKNSASYNVSVAVAATLFETLRQKKIPLKKGELK
ncbi:MAG: 23S rRNA (guanosine(2251)-2'-O)-methyltransferase RlmB [Bdellovibrionales bacterium]|nr:23S rRNA (guanosine(2251)-2'-O)-methyltransferase RlmB [Bdellovibrionales bacterium]